jgi:hypothetical protein
MINLSKMAKLCVKEEVKELARGAGFITILIHSNAYD